MFFFVVLLAQSIDRASTSTRSSDSRTRSMSAFLLTVPGKKKWGFVVRLPCMLHERAVGYEDLIGSVDKGCRTSYVQEYERERERLLYISFTTA